MRKVVYIVIVTILLFSCEEKGYDLKVNNADPILIVDARVESNTKKVKVNLSESTDFLGDIPQKFVNDASVFIKIDDSEEQQLDFLSEGNYELDNIKVSEGTQYQLRIVVGEDEYTSESEMLNIVPVDLFLIDETLGGGNPDDTLKTYAFNMLLNIDLSKTNYYLTETEIKYSNADESRIGNDAYLQWDDGSYNSNPAFFPYFVEFYYPGDSVDVKFSHIPLTVFEFYNSLSDVAGQSPSSLAPSNPLSNISNGAIGTFGAYATFDTTLVINP